MASPSHELVLYARDRLLKAASVISIVGDRTWYRAPENPTFPYIAGFETFGLRDDATCIEGEDITMNVHVWSRADLDPLQEARQISHAVAQALHDYPLALPANRLVTLEHRGERVFYDVDDLTGHGVVEFRAIIEVL
jgi:hypothetical protein